MKRYEFESQGHLINVYIKDNKSKKTIVFLHGFNSSHKFAEKIYSLSNNFNIITFDFPFERVSFELFVQITNDVLDKVAKTEVILLGHSLGGAINLFVDKHPKVSERILIAPLNPSITKSKRYQMFMKVMKPESRIQKVQASVLKKAVTKVAQHQENKLLETFMDESSDFNKIVMEQILSQEFMSKLDEHYKTKEAHYIIGSLDEVISPKLFKNYMNELQKEVILIDGAFHNPFRTHSAEMHQFLNGKVLFKRR